ncbi:PglZ domain-containing protein [Halochromatium glycolicum]|nr:PglZ domain-containing protein [Halochromatium glycolicum]
MAELGQAVERIRPELSRMGEDAAKCFSAYTRDDGWHSVDGLQWHLETWVAHMDEEPEAEQALGVVRDAHEQLLKAMAEGIVDALEAAGWQVPSTLHQTHVYPDVVETMGGRVAYFLIDAMRYEMGVELARQIEGATDLTVSAAVSALPSITPVGMAALLPGASASFDLLDAKGRLGAQIEDRVMPGLNERLKFLKAKVPGVADMTLGKLLGKLLGKKPSQLAKDIAKAPLVVVRPQEIDFVGEMDGDLLARQVMDTTMGNLARAVKKLAAAGVEDFVITADHGHQFSVRKEDDMKTDNPGGDRLELHRRCWIGHGGSTPAGTVRVSGAELGYHTDLDFIFPTGLEVFKAGGGLAFHHGGFSLQELAIPVVSLRMASGKSAALPGIGVRIEDCPVAVTNRTFGLKLVAQADLLATEPLTVRVLLMAGSDKVGRAGMAVGRDFDRAKGSRTLPLGATTSVGMMLNNDACKTLRVVVLDAGTDGVLAQSDELAVILGI